MPLSYLLPLAAPAPNPFRKRFRDHFPMRPIAELPRRVDGSAYIAAILNQGAEGSCSAFSGTYINQALRLKLRGESVKLSEAALYQVERQQSGTLTQDRGATLEATQAALQLVGQPPEADDPYTPQDFVVRLTPAILADAARYRIADGYWASSLEEILNALAQGFFPQLGIVVFPGMQGAHANATGQVPLPEAGATAEGGHALACVSYDRATETVSGPNSWILPDGTPWGDHGYYHLPWAYLRDPALLMDARVYQL